MNKKRLVIMSVISIILVSILMIGSTYSIFTTSDVDEESNVYTTGNLQVEYAVDSSNVTLSSKEVVNVEDENTVIPYRITITNNGSVPYMFDLILEDTTSTDVIDYQYIMTKVGYLESKSLANCTDNIIKEDIILPAGESVDIDVRVYLSDTLQNTEINKSFFAKLKVDGIAIYDKNESIDNSILSLVYMKGFEFDEENLVITGDVFYHNSTYEEYIKNVSFVNYIDTTNAVESWDVSEDSDGSITAWVVNNETEGYYDLYIGSKNVIFARDLSYLFYKLISVDNISFDNLDTSLTINMEGMFNRCGYNSTVFALDLGDKFNTSNVENMQKLFSGVGYSSTVFTLDLGDKFDTSKVTDMSYMFNGMGLQSTVIKLELGDKFDTSNVIDMSYMFHMTGYNSTVFTLDLGEKFDTSKVTDMSYMFNGMGLQSTIIKLDLGDKFDTTNVTNMQYMFMNIGRNNTSFTLNLGTKFNTSNVENMKQMFGYIGVENSTFELDLSTFAFSNVTTYDGIFEGFTTSKKIYVKDTTAQNWIITNSGNSNLTTSNVLVKS